MLGDGLCVFHVGFAVVGEFGVVVPRDTGVVDEQLDARGFFAGDVRDEVLDVLFVGDIRGDAIDMFQHLYGRAVCCGVYTG